MHFLTQQHGAMFGLDARIALGIFGALSVIAGAYTAVNMHKIHADSFAQELQETATAIEAIHSDLRADLHNSLEDNTDGHAFMALYDSFKLKPELRGKWLGPYIKAAVPVHPRYGEVRIQKRAQSSQQDCADGVTCYLWLTYDNVPLNVAKNLNETFDGREEIDHALDGRLQWQGGFKANHVILAFRATRALGAVRYY